MAQRVRKSYRGQKSFVCHTTPHFGSTSRRDSYSVGHIIHDMEKKVNTLLKNTWRHCNIFPS